jgi:hypothetical protein
MTSISNDYELKTGVRLGNNLSGKRRSTDVLLKGPALKSLSKIIFN